MFARIRHVAIYTENYDLTAKFYKTVFGMKQITSGMVDENGERHAERGFLSDGVIELALLRRDPGDRSGLDHFGFEVEDSKTAVERITQNFPDVMIRESLATVPFAERRVHDPLGVSFDISERSNKAKAARYLPGIAPGGWDQPRHFNHVTIRVAKPGLAAEFFKKVFELSEVQNLSDEGAFCLTDGRSYLVIRSCDTSSYNTMKNGLDHIGFKVEELEKARKDLDDIGASFPQSASPKIALPHRQFGEINQKNMDGCRLGKHAACDPSGVLVDLST